MYAGGLVRYIVGVSTLLGVLNLLSASTSAGANRSYYGSSYKSINQEYIYDYERDNNRRVNLLCENMSPSERAV